MRVVLDTNVLVSGIYFAGVPGDVLEAWRQGRIGFVVTAANLDEYDRVASDFGLRHGFTRADEVLAAIATSASMVEEPPPGEPITRDPDDDKFIRCAAARRAAVVSGDNDLLAVDGRHGVRVLTPRQILDLLP
ncbi:MAG: putative toxin-antitoxin system toxin component, PIN family [Phycisphaerae bacterium]|nr:putative toxin-antitoxin system toxin component, PIN family [Phycisphaerae bacterium]